MISMGSLSITDQTLKDLCDEIKGRMSARRFEHTLGVEQMADRISAIYCPEKRQMLRAAALLHDVTKELSVEEQITIFERYGEPLDNCFIDSPPLMHAITAALIIPTEFENLATDELVEAVRYHTTGRAGMSLSEKIIYLSDYIEHNRTYDDCIQLRDMFWGADMENMSDDERMLHLDRVLAESFDMTVADLCRRDKKVCPNTASARDYLIQEIKELENKVN